ncbi:MAG: radical SAM protein [Chloroflexi bacterium]|nr:radical SAM protein [Chloroflexota bacterium]MDA1218475.1 radical SAM protein [Chloroflexota bacterium]PKB56852.1 MAG: radical SAM protein [SAR202 cluster bacterium Casp-Chloro-G3]
MDTVRGEAPKSRVKQDADYIFHELTRSICPDCKTVIDAQIIIRDNKVFMRKRCPTHGWFEGIISSDAEMYVDSVKFNKPGTIPLDFSTEVKDGCPLDCGLCPEHKQHMCLALIEVNSACNLNCPVCFANAGLGFSLTMEQVEKMLDRFVETEGDPEVVQFSGGEPTIHPQLFEMIQAAQDRGIRQVMVNTNGVRIAKDDRFLAGLAKLNPVIYFQFDGLRRETYEVIRGEDLLDIKMLALDRIHEAGMSAVLVAAIERGVNVGEVGAIVEFGLAHPAVRGVVLQPVTHVGRHIDFDPMQRVTIPDVIHGIVDQSKGRFVMEDFVPVPCCFPTCQVNSYVFVDGDKTVPLPRLLEIDQYLDYITNRALPKAPNAADVQKALEGLWSASAVAGTEKTASQFECACGPGLDLPYSMNHLKDHIFQIAIKDFMDAYTFNVKQVMKCCVGILVPDGRAIPFCAYNSVGYREEIREQLTLEQARSKIELARRSNS